MVPSALACSITSASECSGGAHAEVRRRGFERPTQIISTSATIGKTALEHRGEGRRGIASGGNFGQAVEVEVGVGVDHPANQRPLLIGVSVRPASASMIGKSRARWRAPAAVSCSVAVLAVVDGLRRLESWRVGSHAVMMRMADRGPD